MLQIHLPLAGGTTSARVSWGVAPHVGLCSAALGWRPAVNPGLATDDVSIVIFQHLTKTLLTGEPDFNLLGRAGDVHRTFCAISSASSRVHTKRSIRTHRHD